MAPRFLQPENVLIELNGPFQVVDAIARMQEFFDLAHGLTITRNRLQAKEIGKEWSADALVRALSKRAIQCRGRGRPRSNLESAVG